MMADKLVVEITKHTLTYISEEMGVALRKSAYSPNIRERADHSCALLDGAGQTIGQAEHIPVHIGSLPLGLRNTLEYLKEHGVQPQPGEMYFLNDPYIAGTHLNDVTVLRPVFLNGRLIGYAANKAHHVDVGGISPASIGTKATDLSQEGVVMEPTKLMESNQLIGTAANQFASKTRMPAVVLGDLRAQVAANLLGDRRLTEFVSKIGIDTFTSSCAAILHQTYSFAVAEYRKMPKGKFIGEDYLELDDSLLPIHVIVHLMDQKVEVDFRGTAPQVQFPLNAVMGVTTSAVTFAIKSLMPPELPPNDGFNRTIDIDAPLGCLVNPVKPAPVAGGNLETSQRIVDAVYRALIEAMPDRLPAASHGSMNNLMMGGIRPRTHERWVLYETIGGGYGGRLGLDGVDGVQVNMTNTMNTPIEVIEHYYPIVFESYALRSGTGGDGEWRGGVGIERSFTAQTEVQVTLLGERSKLRPWGCQGGAQGEGSQYLIRKPDGTSLTLKAKGSTILKPSETLIIRTAGGGGYGDPQKREPRLRTQDLENGYVT
jgi:N-methylhydantoinase B